jgi:hypothetical protein
LHKAKIVARAAGSSTEVNIGPRADAMHTMRLKIAAAA